MHPWPLPEDLVSSCKSRGVDALGKTQTDPPAPLLGGPSLAVSGQTGLDELSNCSDPSLSWIPCLQFDSPCLAGVLLLRKCGDLGTISVHS